MNKLENIGHEETVTGNNSASLVTLYARTECNQVLSERGKPFVGVIMCTHSMMIYDLHNCYSRKGLLAFDIWPLHDQHGEMSVTRALVADAAPNSPAGISALSYSQMTERKRERST